MRVIASYAVKGGVGKTTTAVNLAYVAAESGVRTLLWDLDPEGAATYLFRVVPHVKGGGEKLIARKRHVDTVLKGTDFEGLDLLPADPSYRNMDIDLARADGKPTRTLARVLGDLAADYDVVFLDTPPSQSLVSENVLRAADIVVVPLPPAVLALRAYDQLRSAAAKLDGKAPVVRAFVSMADRRKSLHREFIETLPDRTDISSIVIPALPAIERMATTRAPLPVFAPKSPATVAYRQLWAEIAAL